MVWAQAVRYMLAGHPPKKKAYAGTYDVACSWAVNLPNRNAQSPFLDLPEWMLDFIVAIGQFHVTGHKPACYCRYCCTFIFGMGLLDAERVETGWSVMNAILNGSRSMALKHRYEKLNDHFGFWNWDKLLRIGDRLILFIHFEYSNGSHTSAFDCWIMEEHTGGISCSP